MNKDNILEVRNVHKRFTSKNVTVKAVTALTSKDTSVTAFTVTFLEVKRL